MSSPTPTYDPAAEVVDLCSELIRFDTSNYGTGEGPGERKAAEYVAGAARRGRDRVDALRIRAGSDEPGRAMGECPRAIRC